MIVHTITIEVTQQWLIDANKSQAWCSGISLTWEQMLAIYAKNEVAFVAAIDTPTTPLPGRHS